LRQKEKKEERKRLHEERLMRQREETEERKIEKKERKRVQSDVYNKLMALYDAGEKEKILSLITLIKLDYGNKFKGRKEEVIKLYSELIVYLSQYIDKSLPISQVEVYRGKFLKNYRLLYAISHRLYNKSLKSLYKKDFTADYIPDQFMIKKVIAQSI
jgi:hypothetical protein